LDATLALGLHRAAVGVASRCRRGCVALPSGLRRALSGLHRSPALEIRATIELPNGKSPSTLFLPFFYHAEPVEK
jgi:hypothetical protein